jgi:hypothetical protein
VFSHLFAIDIESTDKSHDRPFLTVLTIGKADMVSQDGRFDRLFMKDVRNGQTFLRPYRIAVQENDG